MRFFTVMIMAMLMAMLNIATTRASPPSASCYARESINEAPKLLVTSSVDGRSLNAATPIDNLNVSLSPPAAMIGYPTLRLSPIRYAYDFRGRLNATTSTRCIATIYGAPRLLLI